MRSPLHFAITLSLSLILGVGVSLGQRRDDPGAQVPPPLRSGTPACTAVPNRPLTEPVSPSEPPGPYAAMASAIPGCPDVRPGLFAV